MIFRELELTVAGQMIAPEVTGEDPEYQLTIEQGAVLKVDDGQSGSPEEDIINISAVLEASGPGLTTRLELSGQIASTRAWTVEAGAKILADSITTDNSWTVAQGALVQVQTIGINAGDPAPLFVATWHINKGRLEVGGAEGPIRWSIHGDGQSLPPAGKEQLWSWNKAVARRLLIDSKAAVEVGLPDAYGILQAAGAETIVDDSVLKCRDLKTKVASAFNLVTTTLRNGAALSIEELVGDPLGGNPQTGEGVIKPSLGALFYGDGANSFTSLADETIFRHIFELLQPPIPDLYAGSILSVVHQNPQNPALAIDCRTLRINSQTDLTFPYTVDVGGVNEREIQATWDTSGVSLTIRSPSAGDAEVEVVNVDFGDIWFCDVPRMKAWAALTVEAGVSAKLVNGLNNQCHTLGSAPLYPDEAMYVDGLVWVKDNGTLDLMDTTSSPRNRRRLTARSSSTAARSSS